MDEPWESYAQLNNLVKKRYILYDFFNEISRLVKFLESKQWLSEAGCGRKWVVFESESSFSSAK